MSSLSYNPNINIPSYHNMTNDYTVPIEQFRPDTKSSNYYNSEGKSSKYYNSENMMGNNMMGNNMMGNNMMGNNMMGNNTMGNTMENYNNMMPMMPMNYNPSYLPTNNYKKSINTYEPFKNDNSKIDWYLIGKKIVIYTILFLIMSHLIMNNMICRFIPFVGENEIACMVMKGFIMSIVIIILQTIL
jgi:hypothetical protein